MCKAWLLLFSYLFYCILHTKVLVYTAEFSLSFKVDSKDVKVSSLAIKCWKQFKAFSTPSLYPLSPKRRRLIPQYSHFLTGCLMRTLTQPLFTIYFFSLAYKFCFLIELHVKGKLWTLKGSSTIKDIENS